mmetsp:Transcript_17968/g.42965  ORF Transcript_17968/g.42965 Transcript_17968/m.42965 type:complete len:92 (-) Transcript_17968:244-519(-)
MTAPKPRLPLTFSVSKTILIISLQNPDSRLKAHITLSKLTRTTPCASLLCNSSALALHRKCKGKMQVDCRRGLFSCRTFHVAENKEHDFES